MVDHDEFMQHGVNMGWWESFDEKGPIPFPIFFVIETREIRENINGLWKTTYVLEEHENTIAHILGNCGAFDSVGQAKKNGWKKPIQPCEVKLKRIHRVLKIVEE